MKTTFEVQDRFVSLAELLLQMTLESQEYKLPDDFKMPESTIDLTAISLARGFALGEFQETDGGLYYSGMMEDYGGYFESVLDIAQNEFLKQEKMQEDSITVFKNKLAAFAKAAEELDNAWDYVDGDAQVVNALIELDNEKIAWPFEKQLYYLALKDAQVWGKILASKLK